MQELTDEYIASTRPDYISRGSAKVLYNLPLFETYIALYISTILGGRSCQTVIHDVVLCLACPKSILCCPLLIILRMRI